MQALRTRGEKTRHELMRTAERLFAERGLAQVSVRSIVSEAGQKNESALQYHFGGREGLIAALHAQRSQQILVERRKVIESIQASPTGVDLRGVALLMAQPPFRLASRDPGFRNYLRVFTPLLLFSSQEVLRFVSQRESVAEFHRLLTRLLPDLDPRLIEARAEDAARFAAQALSHHAQQKRAFRGRSADLFLSNLVDVMSAILSATPSAATAALLGRE